MSTDFKCKNTSDDVFSTDFKCKNTSDDVFGEKFALGEATKDSEPLKSSFFMCFLAFRF